MHPLKWQKNEVFKEKIGYKSWGQGISRYTKAVFLIESNYGYL
jgi:hypothetical protein